jgi:hypothetical protein
LLTTNEAKDHASTNWDSWTQTRAVPTHALKEITRRLRCPESPGYVAKKCTSAKYWHANT